MSLPAEERVNMSLDELIKVGRKTSKNKKTPNKLQNKKEKKVTGKPNSEASQKAAQVIGAGKAKRAAVTNQKRGLNSTGKATQEEIAKAVATTAASLAPKKKKKKPAKANVGIISKAAGPGLKSGLKISFNPAELGQTTDKTVILQIRGALSKGTKPSKAPVHGNNLNRVVKPVGPGRVFIKKA